MIPFEKLPEVVAQIQETVTDIKSLLLALNHSTQPEPDELLTVESAASYLSIAVSTIYTKISRGELPVMKNGKRCYFSKTELLKYLKQGRQKTNSEIAKEADKYFAKRAQIKMLTPKNK